MVHVSQILVKGHTAGSLLTIKTKPKKQIISYTYPISITNCELMAKLITLTYIKNNPPLPIKINIFTDCQLVLQYLDFTT